MTPPNNAEVGELLGCPTAIMRWLYSFLYLYYNTPQKNKKTRKKQNKWNKYYISKRYKYDNHIVNYTFQTFHNLRWLAEGFFL